MNLTSVENADAYSEILNDKSLASAIDSKISMITGEITHQDSNIQQVFTKYNDYVASILNKIEFIKKKRDELKNKPEQEVVEKIQPKSEEEKLLDELNNVFIE